MSKILKEKLRILIMPCKEPLSKRRMQLAKTMLLLWRVWRNLLCKPGSSPSSCARSLASSLITISKLNFMTTGDQDWNCIKVKISWMMSRTSMLAYWVWKLSWISRRRPTQKTSTWTSSAMPPRSSITSRDGCSPSSSPSDPSKWSKSLNKHSIMLDDWKWIFHDKILYCPNDIEN